MLGSILEFIKGLAITSWVFSICLILWFVYLYREDFIKKPSKYIEEHEDVEEYL